MHFDLLLAIDLPSQDVRDTGALFSNVDTENYAQIIDIAEEQNAALYDFPPLFDADEPPTTRPDETPEFALPRHPASTTVSSESSQAEDRSTALPNNRRVHETISPFKYALGLWCIDAGISRTQYIALREVLSLLKNNTDTAFELENLPKRIDQLKEHTKAQLPRLELRKADIKLQAEDLPSSVRGQHVTREPKEPLVFFNPDDLIRRILSSELYYQMHMGLGHFVDEPRELWHTPAWTGSVRTTSGQYAHIQNLDLDGNLIIGEAIFPSDWIVYHTSDGAVAMGQVSQVGIFHLTNTTLNIEDGTIALTVYRALQASNVL